MGLRWWFNKEKVQPDAALNAIPARHGNVFQTCTFRQPVMPMLGNFFLKAKRGPEQKWTVYRVSERPDGPAAGPDDLVVSQEKAKEGLTFFEALIYLSNFESTAPDVKYEAVDPAEKETLGFRHYVAFAHREGFMFDRITGRPALTDHGEIEGTGTFAKSEITLFRQHCEAARLQPVPVDNNDLLQTLMPEKGFTMPSLELITELNEIKTWMTEFVEDLNSLKETILHWRRISNEDAGNDSSQSRFSGRFEKLDEMLDEAEYMEGMNDEDFEGLRRGVKVALLFTKIEHAQFYMDNDEYLDCFEEAVDEAKEVLEDLELPEDYADAAYYRKPDLTNKELPQPVEDFIKNCEAVRDAFADALKAAKKGEKTYPPALPASPSRPLLMPPGPAP